MIQKTKTTMKKFVLLFVLLATAYLGGQAQQTYAVTVSGTVVDSSGNPVQGQWVYVKFDTLPVQGIIWVSVIQCSPIPVGSIP